MKDGHDNLSVDKCETCQSRLKEQEESGENILDECECGHYYEIGDSYCHNCFLDVRLSA